MSGAVARTTGQFSGARAVRLEVVRHLKPLAKLIIDLLRASQIDQVHNTVDASRDHAGDTRIINPLRPVKRHLD